MTVVCYVAKTFLKEVSRKKEIQKVGPETWNTQYKRAEDFYFTRTHMCTRMHEHTHTDTHVDADRACSIKEKEEDMRVFLIYFLNLLVWNTERSNAAAKGCVFCVCVCVCVCCNLYSDGLEKKQRVSGASLWYSIIDAV